MLSTVAVAANDPDLQARVQASVYSEAISNPDLKDTQFAAQVRTGYAPLTGMANGRGSPGHDRDVVDDGAITSAVVANWPPDPPVVNP